MAETEIDTDDLEQSILEFMEDWKSNKSVEDAIVGPIQALARMLIFAHDMEKELRGLTDENQFHELCEIILEAQGHVHENSTTVIRTSNDRVH